jgi:hypothetical protein
MPCCEKLEENCGNRALGLSEVPYKACEKAYRFKTGSSRSCETSLIRDEVRQLRM